MLRRAVPDGYRSASGTSTRSVPLARSRGLVSAVDPAYSPAASEIVVAGTGLAPEAPRPDIEVEHYPELDIARGLAAVAFVLFTVYQFCNVDHYLYKGTPAYTILDSLDAAVPLFFVVTAFLLFRPIARAAIDGTAAISIRSFLARRALRVLPVYYLAVILVWFSRQRGLPGDWRDLLEHLTFTQIFDEKRIFYTLGPGWAVSVAVFFYVLVIALSVGLMPVCRRLSSRRSRTAFLLSTIAILGSASLAWKAWNFSAGRRPADGAFTVWFGPLSALDVFAAGMTVAVLAAFFEGRRRSGPLTSVALGCVALVLLTGAFAARNGDGWSGVYFPTVCATGFAALIAGVIFASPSGKRIPGWSSTPIRRCLLSLGAISYSVFIWQEPVLLELRRFGGIVRQSPDVFVPDAFLVLLGSLVVGSISYLIVETPFRRLAAYVPPTARLGSPEGDRDLRAPDTVVPRSGHE